MMRYYSFSFDQEYRKFWLLFDINIKSYNNLDNTHKYLRGDIIYTH